MFLPTYDDKPMHVYKNRMSIVEHFTHLVITASKLAAMNNTAILLAVLSLTGLIANSFGE